MSGLWLTLAFGTDYSDPLIGQHAVLPMHIYGHVSTNIIQQDNSSPQKDSF